MPNGFTSVETFVETAGKAPSFSWGSTFGDFNNDGWEDLIFAGSFLDSP